METYVYNYYILSFSLLYFSLLLFTCVFLEARQVLTGRFALSKKKQFLSKAVSMLEFPDSIIRLIKVRVIQICLTTVYFLAYIYH